MGKKRQFNRRPARVQLAAVEPIDFGAPLRLANLRVVALRLLLAYLVLLSVFLPSGNRYPEAFLPLYQPVASWLKADFPVVEITIGKRGQENAVLLTLQAGDNSWVGATRLQPGSYIKTATLTGHVIQHPILLFSLVLAWPFGSRLKGLVRLLASLPLLVAVELLDAPFSLVGMADQRMLATFSSAQDMDVSFPLHWARYLEGGVRFLLPVAAAVCAIVLGERCGGWIEKRRSALPDPAV